MTLELWPTIAALSSTAAAYLFVTNMALRSEVSELSGIVSALIEDKLMTVVMKAQEEKKED